MMVLGRLSSLSPYRTWFTRAVGTGTAQKSCTLAKTENYRELSQGNDTKFWQQMLRFIVKKNHQRVFFSCHHTHLIPQSVKTTLGTYLDIDQLFRRLEAEPLDGRLQAI
jgi:hypothetical protein